MEQPRSLIALALLALGACGSPEQRLAERALHDGVLAHQDSAFLAADSAFAVAPGDPRVLYDRGVNMIALKDPAAASGYFEAAARLDSSAVRRMAFYNLGNARLDDARQAESSVSRIRLEVGRVKPATDDINDRLRALVQVDSMQRTAERLDAGIDSSLLASMESYKATLRLDPANEDARHNLMLAKAAWSQRQKEKERQGRDKDDQQDKALTEKAKMLIQKADDLVEAYRFQEALQLLQDGLKKEPSLRSKKEYMDKLDLVTKAALAS